MGYITLIDGLEIEYIEFGNPTEAEGKIDGHGFYFRYQTNAWYLNVGGSDPLESPNWRYSEELGEDDESSFDKTESDICSLIRKAMLMLRQSLGEKITEPYQ